jgi:hypothetical protein
LGLTYHIHLSIHPLINSFLVEYSLTQGRLSIRLPVLLVAMHSSTEHQIIVSTLSGAQASNVVDLVAIAADAQNLCSCNLSKNTIKAYSDRLKILVEKMLVLYPTSKFIVNRRLHPLHSRD